MWNALTFGKKTIKKKIYLKYLKWILIEIENGVAQQKLIKDIKIDVKRDIYIKYSINLNVKSYFNEISRKFRKHLKQQF